MGNPEHVGLCHYTNTIQDFLTIMNFVPRLNFHFKRVGEQVDKKPVGMMGRGLLLWTSTGLQKEQEAFKSP